MSVELSTTEEITRLWQAITSGRVSYTSYVNLQVAISRPLGSIAEVQGDAGQHTDPVSSEIVDNDGVYRRVEEGWQRIASVPADLLEDFAALVAAAELSLVNATGTATTAKDDAEAAAAVAAGHVVETEAARDAAVAGANIYADTAAGIAGVADGEYFQIPSAEGGYVDLYRRNGAAADYVDTLPNLAAVTISSLTILQASYEQYLFQLSREDNRPIALVGVWPGQSLNAERGAALADTISPPNCFMPVGGPSSAAMDYFALNNDWTVDWAEMESFVPYQVGVGETPISGALNILAPHFPRIYAYSCAVGARAFLTMMTRGQMTNYQMFVQRACEDARANGFRPVVVLFPREGEADAAANNDYATIHRRSQFVFRHMQSMAARYMGEADYFAPIFASRIVFGPGGVGGAASRTVHRVYDALERSIPNLTARAQYNVRMEADRTHPEETGYRQNGENDAYEALDFFVRGVRRNGFTSRVQWRTGTTSARIVFSEPAVDMAGSGADFGTGALNIDTAGQWKGFQWFDNGTKINISSGTLYPTHAEITLASIPSGTLEQQVVRQAAQAMTSSLTGNSENVAGSTIAADDPHKAPTIIEAADAVYSLNRRYLVPTEIQVEAI